VPTATPIPMRSFDLRVSVVLQAIDARLSESSLSNGLLAGLVALSPSRLGQLFRQQLNTSVKQYLVDRRMTCANELLRSSFMSVKEVRAVVGISDGSHFCREYKRRYGINPSDERSRSTTSSVIVNSA